jgi:hypothetical protein
MPSLVQSSPGIPRPGLSRALMRSVLEDVKQRHITVTSYCPVLDRFIEKNPGYAPLVGSGNAGNWPKSGRNARVSPACNPDGAANPTCQVHQRKDAA